MNEFQRRIDYIHKSISQLVQDGYISARDLPTKDEIRALGASEVAQLYKQYKETDDTINRLCR